MADLTGVWEKVRRTRHHIDDVEAVIVAFHERDPHPYQVIRENNLDDGTARYIVRSVEPLPDDVPLILGDAVHNLRSALDLFAYAVVPNAVNNPNVAFPIVRRGAPTDLPSLIGSKLNGADLMLKQAIQACEPYQGGKGDALWTLDRLDVADKHHLLIPVVTATRSITIDLMGLFDPTFRASLGENITAIPIALVPADKEVYPGAILFTADADKDPDPKFTFEVALSESGLPGPLPAIPTLRRLVDEVEGLLQKLAPLA